MTTSTSRHQQQGRHEADGGEQEAAEEEAGTLHRVLRAGQDRHPLEQRALGPLGDDQLDRRLGAHLGEVLGNAGEPLHRRRIGHGPEQGPGGIEQAEQCQGQDLQAEPGIERGVEAEPGGDPAAPEVGHHAHQLVEDEQQRDLKGREAERIEMQQHEHVQGAIGDRLAPVGGGDDAIGADVHALASSAPATLATSSTSRQE
jgi:hypothetical protein